MNTMEEDNGNEPVSSASGEALPSGVVEATTAPPVTSSSVEDQDQDGIANLENLPPAMISAAAATEHRNSSNHSTDHLHQLQHNASNNAMNLVPTNTATATVTTTTDILSASMVNNPDELLEVDEDGDDDPSHNPLMTQPASPLLPTSSRFHHQPPLVPEREETTLKEKLVDRERQRRKEAERARLKRQFALTSNGGGMVYDDAAPNNNDNSNSASAALPNQYRAAVENNSVCGTVGEESSTAAHADLDDSMTRNHNKDNQHHHHGDAEPPLNFTMERFLQERGGGGAGATATTPATTPTPATTINHNNVDTTDPNDDTPHRAVSTSSSAGAIREEAIEEMKQSSEAPDKTVVMERFLNDPVLVDADPNLTQDETAEPPPDRRPDDVHRSVSFDMELRTSALQVIDDDDDNENNDTGNMNINNNGNDNDNNNVARGTFTEDAMQHFSPRLDESQSNVSVRVEVAPEDHLMENSMMSPMGGVPSSVAAHVDTSLGSGTSTNRIDEDDGDDNNNRRNNDSVDDEEPRVLRLTEAEIEEMNAIEEASIGNAPPSDRDEESLVGELVGEFGTPSALGTNDPAGTTFSQGTPTTAMESGSVLSGNAMVQPLNNIMQNGRHTASEPDHGSNMDDDDSIDNMATSASVSSHLVVSPGASLSGSGGSLQAHPPSENIGRGEPASTIMDGVDDDDSDNDDDDVGDFDNDDNDDEPPPPPPAIVGGSSEPERSSSSPPRVVLTDNNNNDMGGGSNKNNEGVARLEPRRECPNTLQIREELLASGPDAAGIVNRRLRPGMVPGSPMQRIVSLPERLHTANNAMDYTPRSIDEFDFDKNDNPLSPRSHLSDSIRDLPGDELWNSPGRKMIVSPMPYPQGRDTQKAAARSLQIPNMEPDSKLQQQKPLLTLTEEESPLSLSMLANVKSAFGELRTNLNSTVNVKESEVYIRSDLMSKGESPRCSYKSPLSFKLYT